MISKIVIVSTAVLLMSSNFAWAQNVGDVEVAEATIRLMGAADAELPGTVIREISLPPTISENSAAVENAARGLETANENQARREDGLSRADEARERGAEMSDEASQNRENRGRSEENRPETPEPPKSPGPPGGA